MKNYLFTEKVKIEIQTQAGSYPRLDCCQTFIYFIVNVTVFVILHFDRHAFSVDK